MYTVSDINAKGPPVPIPNTEVKLGSAENTQPEAARENRSSLTQSITRKGNVHRKLVGVISVEGPPVPIPNTEVKLNCAENT